MAEVKTLPTDASVDAFIDSISNQGRKQDAETLLGMMKLASGAEPVMWGTKHYWLWFIPLSLCLRA